jgi:hypothetical protein
VQKLWGAWQLDDVDEVRNSKRVEYLKYWFDEGSGKVFCLAKGPSKEAVIAVHREAHGLFADEVTEVKEGM